MRPHPIRSSACLLGVLSAAVWLAACSSGTDSTTAPLPTNLSVAGDWTFTLTSTDSTQTDAVSTVSHVLVIDKDGVLIGTGDRFRFDGERRDTLVDLSVYAPQGKDGFVKQTTMHLSLHGDTLTGAGAFFHPTIDPILNADGSVHPKDATANADSLILDGSEIYTVTGVRTGPLTASSAALVEEGKSLMPVSGPSRDFASDLCTFFSSISSFFIGKMTGGTFRPMGSCYGQWDGGGYYMFGRVGPGSITPVYTETFYQPQEWAPCTVRTYNFWIDIGGTTTGTTVANQFYLLDPAWWLSQNMGVTSGPGGITNYGFGITFDQWVNELVQVTGGFAITLAHSEYTNNWSIYVNTVNPVTYNDVYTSPLPNLIVRTLIGLAGQGHVWAFAGPHIHDHWNLKRAAWGNLCATPLDFIYLFGTNNVTYN